MKKFFLTGIAALLLATGTAHAAEVKKDLLLVLLKEDAAYSAAVAFYITTRSMDSRCK